MRISEYQLVIALDALRGSLLIPDGDNIFTFNMDSRRRTYLEIVSQADGTLIKIGGLTAKDAQPAMS